MIVGFHCGKNDSLRHALVLTKSPSINLHKKAHFLPLPVSSKIQSNVSSGVRVDMYGLKYRIVALFGTCTTTRIQAHRRLP